MRRLEPTFIAGLCIYELAGLAGLAKPLTHIFREHPATFFAFVAWLCLHTWRRR